MGTIEAGPTGTEHLSATVAEEALPGARHAQGARPRAKASVEMVAAAIRDQVVDLGGDPNVWAPSVLGTSIVRGRGGWSAGTSGASRRGRALALPSGVARCST